MMKINTTVRRYEAGSGHLVLMGVIVLAIIAILGVVGFNAFKRSQLASTQSVSGEEALVLAKRALDRSKVEAITDAEKAAREDANAETKQSIASNSTSGNASSVNSGGSGEQGNNGSDRPTNPDKSPGFQTDKPETFTYSGEGLCQLNGYLYIRDESKNSDTSVLEVSFDGISPFTYKLEYHLNGADGFATESQNYLGTPQFSNKNIKPGVNYFKTGIAGKNIRVSALRTGANKWTTIHNDKPITEIPQCANIAFTEGNLSMCQHQDVIYVKRSQKPYDSGNGSTAKLGFRFDRTMTAVANLYERGPGVHYFSGKIRGRQFELIRTSNDIYAQKFGAQDIEYSGDVNGIPACRFLQ